MQAHKRLGIMSNAVLLGVLLLSTLSANSLGATKVSLETAEYGDYGAYYVHLDWSRTQDVLFVNYEVFLKTEGGEWKNIERIENGDKTDFNVTGLKPSIAYWFKIRDNDSLGSKDSDEIGVITAQLTPVDLDRPAGEDIALSTITLQWSVNQDFHFRKYHVVLREYQGNTTIDIVNERYEAEYVVAGLSSNETYCFFIQVENDLGELSDPSNVECPRTTTPVEITPTSNPWEIATYILVILVIAIVVGMIYFALRRRNYYP